MLVTSFYKWRKDQNFPNSNWWSRLALTFWSFTSQMIHEKPDYDSFSQQIHIYLICTMKTNGICRLTCARNGMYTSFKRDFNKYSLRTAQNVVSSYSEHRCRMRSYVNTIEWMRRSWPKAPKQTEFSPICCAGTVPISWMAFWNYKTCAWNTFNFKWYPHFYDTIPAQMNAGHKVFAYHHFQFWQDN